MNQILSVEMPKSTKRKAYKSNGPKKASTKSVIIFFCIVLLIFGITIIGLGIYSNLNKTKENEQDISAFKPSIIITQDLSKLNLKISGKNIIDKIKYSWNEEATKEVEGNGTTLLETAIQIPSGANTLYIEAIDVKGISSSYSHEYSAPDEPNVEIGLNERTNSLDIVCTETDKITYISYQYDDEDAVTKPVNNTTAEISIPIKEGAHDLTIKEEFEQGPAKEKTQKVYFPEVKIQYNETKTGVIVTASDVSKISRVKINFNGEEIEEEVNSETFERTLLSISGENKLIVTVFNTQREDGSGGVSITKRVRWEK